MRYIVKTTKDQGKAVGQARKNTSSLEEVNYATSTVQIKGIEVFLLATVNYKALCLDKSRSFTTSMDKKVRPPMLLFYARLKGMIVDSYMNTWSSLIIKEKTKALKCFYLQQSTTSHFT